MDPDETVRTYRSRRWLLGTYDREVPSKNHVHEVGDRALARPATSLRSDWRGA